MSYVTRRLDVVGPGLEWWLQGALKNVDSLHLSVLPLWAYGCGFVVLGGCCPPSFPSPLQAGRSRKGAVRGVCRKQEPVSGMCKLSPRPYACVLLAITVCTATLIGKAVWGAYYTLDKTKVLVIRNKGEWIVGNWHSAYT